MNRLPEFPPIKQPHAEEPTSDEAIVELRVNPGRESSHFKHIFAWVCENNPHVYVKDSFVTYFLPHISINTPAEPHTNGIIVLNFAHPLTMQQQTQIEELSNTTIENIITISTLINEEEPLEPQIASLIEAVDQFTLDWNKRDILLNPPGYAPAVILLLAEIHGRIGHFPTLIRMRPKHSFSYYLRSNTTPQPANNPRRCAQIH